MTGPFSSIMCRSEGMAQFCKMLLCSIRPLCSILLLGITA